MNRPFPADSDNTPVMRVAAAGVSLHSTFQAIASLAHGKVVGYEALLRGESLAGAPMGPGEIFPLLVASQSASGVNELCARLHLQSFTKQKREGWLFLNVSPDAMTSREDVVEKFGAWLREAGIPPHRVVAEIIETRTFDEGLLARAVEGFRDLGCLVAIDDFGAGESNFERVWRLRPDLVKLDRAMIVEASNNPFVRRIIPGIVSLIHEAGCLVVMEGIETEEQAKIAAECNIDFVQGYYFCKPSPDQVPTKEVSQLIRGLQEILRSDISQRESVEEGYYREFRNALSLGTRSLSAGASLLHVASIMLELAGTQRVYLLDSSGYQVGSNVEDESERDCRFEPCADADGASWYRRGYFQKAIEKPQNIYTSAPYLSVRDKVSCVTLSMAFRLHGELHVLCLDTHAAEADEDVLSTGASLRAVQESGIVAKI